MEAIARRKSQNLADLRRIKGIGYAKVTQYGGAIIEIVSKYDDHMMV